MVFCLNRVKLSQNWGLFQLIILVVINFEFRFCPKAIICIISNPVSFFLFYSLGWKWHVNDNLNLCNIYLTLYWLFFFTHRWTQLFQLQVKYSRKLEFMIQLGKTTCLYLKWLLPILYNVYKSVTKRVQGPFILIPRGQPPFD